MLEFLQEFGPEKRFAFFQSIVLVFIKFSNSIDRPRQDKFSQFFRELFTKMYQL